MPVIMRIRKLLRLEMRTVSISGDFADAAGLYMTESIIRKQEQSPSMDCLINHADNITVHPVSQQTNNSLNGGHFSHHLHF
jgi:hypothetical protein